MTQKPGKTKTWTQPSRSSTDGGLYAWAFTQKAKHVFTVGRNSYKDLKILKTRSNLPPKVNVEQKIHVPDGAICQANRIFTNKLTSAW